MKKVLFVIDKLVMGGAEKVLINIVNNLPKEKYNITILTLFQGGELTNHVNKNVKQISWFKKQHKGIYRVIRYLKPEEIYKKNITEEFDIEIAFKTGMPEKIVAASTNKNSMKIAWIHGDMTFQNYGFESHKNKQKQYECYSKFNKIVFCSEICMYGFKRIIGEFNNFNVVHNGVDLENIRELSKERKEVTYSPDKVIFSNISRLSPEKGLDRLILATERLLKESNKKFKVYIIGEGILKEQLQEMINARKLNQTIILLGGKQNPYKYLHGSDAYILASRSEAFGLSVIESMALRIPVISTDCGGPKEIIGNSEFGILVENSESGIYQGMKLFLEKESLLKDSYSLRSLQRSENYSIETMILKIEELFANGE